MGRFVLLVLVSLGVLGLAYVLATNEPAERRVRKFRLAAAALSTLLGVALCEIPVLFGWLDYRTVLATDGVSTLYNPRYRLDRELIGIHVPHEHFSGEVPGDLVDRLDIETDRKYAVDVAWDANGFRNGAPGDVQIESADVVVLGDSYAEAVLVPFEETVVARLSRSLARPVLNLAHGGYGPQQQWAAMRRFGFGAQPKTVVWMFYEGNDLANAAAYDGIRADWDGWLRREHGFFRRSFVRNAALAFANWSTTTPRNPAIARSRAGRLRNVGDRDGQTMYFGYRCEPLPPAERATLAKTQSLWLAAAKETRAHDIRIVLVFVPTKWRVYRDLVVPVDGSTIGEWRASDLNGLLVRWCASHEIDYVDLTPGLVAAANRGELVYFPDDAHWTAAGNAVVAEILLSEAQLSPR